MIRKIIIPACLAIVLATGCTSDSQLPNPTGKGTVRAINAIAGSPPINFRIEERSLGNLAYQTSSDPAQYDDFDYNFNFEIAVPGQSNLERVATVPFKVEADRDHVFVVTGDINSPTITTWTSDLRQWQDSDTVFEARFAHLSEGMGEVDVFFDIPANAPVAGAQVATLSFGDVMDITDFEEGTYQVTITAAGDVGTVLFQSSEIAFVAQSSHLISIFEGRENFTAPYMLSSMTAAGQAAIFVDASFPPAINFVHAAQTLQTVDAYADEALTSLLASDIALGTASGDVDTEPSTQTYYFTPAGSTATTLLSANVLAVPAGTYSHLYIVGDTDAWLTVRLSQDRTPWSNSVKLRLFSGSLNHGQLDVYVLDRGATLTEDDLPRAAVIGGADSTLATLAAGSYDVYVTDSGTQTVRGGPFEIDVALGDVLFLLAVDDVDPEIVRLSNPFTP